MKTLPPVPAQDSLIEYPCDFPIKVMGRAQDAFVPAVADLIRSFQPDFDPGSIKMRPSKNGNYVGLTLTVRVHSREQLDDIYRALHAHALVSVVL